MNVLLLLLALYLTGILTDFVWLNITTSPVDITLLNDMPLSCEVCYVTLHEQNYEANWCYPLNYKEEATLVFLNLMIYLYFVGKFYWSPICY
jgi:hypothetical protein